MSRRSAITALISVALAVALLTVLAITAKLDVSAFWTLLLSVRLDAFCSLTALAAINIALAGEKWRLVDRHLGGGAMPRRLYISLSAVAQAVGQVLPAQLAFPLTRALGTRLAGSSGSVRSAAGTIVEQLFDIGVLACLAVASLGALAVGATWLWLPTATLTVAVAILAAPPGIVLFEHWLGRVADRLAVVRQFLAGTTAMSAALSRRLVVLSVARFLILWVMACLTTVAIGLDVPPLYLAIALPLVVLATAMPLTPAGIGINEGTFAAVLAAQGTPLDSAIKWALLNRALVCAASLLIGAFGLASSVMLCAGVDRLPSDGSPSRS